MSFIGYFIAAATVDFKFTTRRFSTGAPHQLAGTPAVSVYKSNSVTQSTSGITLTVDFDSLTGLNHVRIDTSSDGTFYADPGQYDVVITAGTVDSVSVVGEVIGRFIIGKPAVDVTHITGSAVSTTTAQIGVNVVQISTDATAADNLETMLDGTGGQTLSLGQLNIVNSAGSAIVATSSGGNGHGAIFTGNGSGEGISANGGATGNGMEAIGGATSGHGLYARSTVTGGNGIRGEGTGASSGIAGVGGATGHGITGNGGATSGSGIIGTGSGASSGIAGVGGTTGHGMNLVGGSTSGNGFNATTTGGNEFDANIVGNITGNLSGSVGSVAAGGITASSIATDAIDADALAADAVAEIQAGLATAASIAALNNLSAAQVNAEVVDALNVDTYAEPGQEAPGATISLAKKIGYLYKFMRNKLTQTSTTLSVFADDATTVDQKATVSDDGTTYTRGEIGTGP